MDTTIREYCDGDFDSVHNIRMEVVKEPYSQAVFLRQSHEVSPDLFLVAECESRILGFIIGACVLNNSKKGWILSFAVEGGCRRTGVGRKLLRGILSKFDSLGANEVYLTVSPENRPAMNLYESEGFRKTDFVPDYFGPGEDRNMMRLVFSRL
ncbi:GNAT family N-acetyltransferase [Methanoplanus sp. FWC-SCC4]|uniref:GNAT family N-acetyltransferase n=1 Tax=Methanochimaera problematica TaxID=2609417 RepID=A0AA97FFG9_9EURY|nr:GNAT family N-acetyltransferase [Methanoplanus sp. FWC-SCC4]WOF17224.1 GNAT family N-acetyltransferase [Methanoplanus sp. FWC-SCC4]